MNANAIVIEVPAVITHPEKVLFPDDGITKGDLAAYYEAMAPVMLPHLRGPTDHDGTIPGRNRQAGVLAEGRVEGISRMAKARRSSQERRRRPSSDRHGHAIVAVDYESEHHHAARLDAHESPTWIIRIFCVFDLDPSQDDPAAVRAAAIGLRDLLDELTLPSWIKTSGSKGFHIVVPLDGETKIGQVERFANAVGRLFVSRAPDQLTQEFSKVDRRGRIYVDTGRNGYSATFAAAYTVRAKRGAPVSAPCTWDEVARGEVNPRTFTLRNMPDRVAKVGDLWADMRRRGRSLKRAMES